MATFICTAVPAANLPKFSTRPLFSPFMPVTFRTISCVRQPSSDLNTRSVVSTKKTCVGTTSRESVESRASAKIKLPSSVAGAVHLTSQLNIRASFHTPESGMSTAASSARSNV